MKQENNNGPIYAMAAVICVVVVVLGVLFSGAIKGGAATTTTIQQNSNLSSVSVSASGSVTGVPSMATVSLYINATGNTTSAATANLSAKLIEFNKTVYSYVGGNTSLIKTSYYNVGKQYQYYPYNTTSNVPYQAQEYIVVTLPQIAKLNSLLANITTIAGLQVQDVSAILSDSQITQLRKQALQLAITNATTQAQSIIGSAMIVNSNVSVGSYYAYPYPIYASANGGGSVLKAGPLYYNGTSSVNENVQAIFYYRT